MISFFEENIEITMPCRSPFKCPPRLPVAGNGRMVTCRSEGSSLDCGSGMENLPETKSFSYRIGLVVRSEREEYEEFTA